LNATHLNESLDVTVTISSVILTWAAVNPSALNYVYTSSNNADYV